MFLFFKSNKQSALPLKCKSWKVITAFRSLGFKRCAFVEMCVARYPEFNNPNGRDYLRAYWEGKVDLCPLFVSKINSVYESVALGC